MKSSSFAKQVIVQTLFLALFVAALWIVPRLSRRDTERGAQTDRPSPRSGSPWSSGAQRGGSRSTTPKTSRTSPSVPVVVAPVARKPIDAFLLSMCNLEARTEVQVLAKISEKVVDIKVEEGKTVKSGDVVATLDRREWELKVREAGARLNNAKATLDRMKRMHANNIVSQEQLDSAQVDYDTAEVQHENAKLYLDYTRVLSPIEGVVVARHIDMGQHAKANEALFTIANYDPIWGRIHVPERDLAKIRVGLPVKVNVESVPGRKFTGKVSMISPVVDPNSGTVKVTFEIPDPLAHGLRPGMFASTHLITETHDNALVLPKKALILESDLNEVFVVKDFVAARIPAEYMASIKTRGSVTVVARPKETEEGKKGKRPADAKKQQPLEIECSFHNVPPAEEGEETIECLVSMPDRHMVTEKMALDLKVKVASPSESGSGKPKTLTIHVREWALRRLAMKRPVKIGFSEGNEVEILSGVKGGDRVVTVGHEDLKQGSAVTIIGTESQGVVQAARKPPPKAAARTKARPSSGGGDWMAKMRERVLSNPQVKAEYEARLKKDPSLAHDREKFFSFLRQMREKGLIQGRGRPRGN